MKKHICAVFLLPPILSFGQWNNNGDNTSTGNVTIGGSFISNGNYGLVVAPTNGDAIIRRGNAGNLMISSNGGSSDVRFNYNYGGGSGGILIFDGGTTNHSSLEVNSSGHLSISSSGGNVGIGTANPVTRLHLNGALRIDGASGGTVGSGLGSRIDLSSGSITAIEENWGINLIGNDAAPVKIRNAALLVGYTSSSAGWGTGGNLLVKGNVGIGTTNPGSFKLAVDGSVKCEEVKVEIFEGTGPDYVFEKDYNLLPLTELEAYVNQNKHLPEVPSAREMEENGLNLKEMNLLLLKKVEELTLHLIEQQKMILELKAEVERNKKN